MEIFPQNLSSRYHIELVRRRSAKGFGEPQVDEPIPKPQLGKLGSYWAQGMDLTEEQAALAAPASAVGTKGVASVTVFLGGNFCCILPPLRSGRPCATRRWDFLSLARAQPRCGFLPMVPLLSLSFARRTKHSLPKEVEDMIGRCQDELTKAYLQLVRDAVLVEANDATTLKVREALFALGEAIDALPAVVIEPQDVTLLRTQAQELAERAHTETDPVIAASLLRQAESAEQRAESQEKSALVGRRAAVLRDEILSKIAALRDAIAAQQSGALDATALAALSESARSVAKESQSAASAHDELARFLAPQEAPQIQKVRQ